MLTRLRHHRRPSAQWQLLFVATAIVLLSAACAGGRAPDLATLGDASNQTQNVESPTSEALSPMATSTPDASIAAGGQPTSEPTAAAPTPRPTPTSEASPIPQPPADMGVITGKLGFPSEVIPPMRVYALNLDTGESYAVETEKNQAAYSLTIPPGTYYVFAYLLDGDATWAGGYSEFVLCDLQASCPSHAPLPVEVAAGAIVEGIDVTDWYAPDNTFPPEEIFAQPSALVQGTVAEGWEDSINVDEFSASSTFVTSSLFVHRRQRTFANGEVIYKRAPRR